MAQEVAEGVEQSDGSTSITAGSDAASQGRGTTAAAVRGVLVGNAGSRVTAAQVAAETGLSPGDVATALRAALRRGEVRRLKRGTYEVVGAGRRSKPHRQAAQNLDREDGDVLRLTRVGELDGRRLYADGSGGLYRGVQLRLVEAGVQ